MKRSFLLQAVATGSLWIGLLLPVLIVALRWNHQRLDKRLLLFFTLIYLDLICALAPRVGIFHRFDWNWQGKILEIIWVALLATLPGYGFARFGIRARLEPRSLGPVLVALLIAP